EAWSNLGNVLRERGSLAEATEACRKAIALRPAFPDAHLNLGSALRSDGQTDEAARSFAQAVALNPNYAEAHANLGTCFLDEGRTEDAIRSFGRSSALRPGYATAKWQLCMANLPIIYKSEEEIEQRRAAYRDAIEGLARDCRTDDPRALAEAAKAVGAAQPFFLAYQGRSDRDLQAAHG